MSVIASFQIVIDGEVIYEATESVTNCKVNSVDNVRKIAQVIAEKYSKQFANITSKCIHFLAISKC